MIIGSERRLVLWDIDHTLVDLTGIGRTWYETALARMGTELHTHPDYGGRTERAISTDVLSSHNIEASEKNIQRLWSKLITLSEESRSTLHESGRALDGAAAAIASLSEAGVLQTLVTGNLPEISHHKLGAFDLLDHLDLEIGGYGTLSTHRPDLVAHAVAAATAKYETTFASEHVIVIGDTPNDVLAALENGVVPVAVATGTYSAEQLTDAGAHIVLTDLTGIEQLRQAVLG